ncbi:hypothetical protein PQC13_gp134 [Synechococcus phage S-SRM01]|uniref:Uncharacterized protein n=1 Tax=Synechococcus phage S-SRM01 TaxID=2781608 RepID=A0A879R2I3_9CAUD|nr:hypothetical protein PQC13_gp134 [Synechococcus phage S-SRM01]QPX48099.1 hypothetical protein [Synechococcus phage S-SRM01]
MLIFGTHRKNTMTLAKSGTEVLSTEEWEELIALKEAINDNPATVHPQKMEKFTELLVRSLEGKCDPPPPKNWRGSSLSE